MVGTSNAQELVGAVNMLSNRTLRLAHQRPSRPDDDDDDDDDDDNKFFYELLHKNEGLTETEKGLEIRKHVVPLISEVRGYVDAYEKVMDAIEYALPTYSEMLY